MSTLETPGVGQANEPNVIDCDADPIMIDGWKVERHKKGGSFRWDPNEVDLYLSKRQHEGKVIKGRELRKELAGKPVLNANVLDYLLARPHLIPETWEKKTISFISFWGTIYRSPAEGDLYVRCLRRGNRGWGWRYCRVDRDWDGNNPVALRAS